MRSLRLIGLVACWSTISSCAGSPQVYLAAPPQIETPAEASRPCALYRLPDEPRASDLDIGYATRGAQIVACDAARNLAVETHAAEHRLEAAQAEARAQTRRWWMFWRRI